MTLDAGWVAAIASVASAVVVVFAAIASFRQIRHFRNTNDIAVYLRLIERLDEADTTALLIKLPVLRARLDDPAFRENLRRADFVDAEYREVGLLLRFLEHFSTLVVTGGVAESLVLAEYADTFVEMWEQLRETVYLRRDAFGPYTGAAFEHLAMRSKRYIESGAMARLYDRLERDPRGGTLADRVAL